MLKDSDPSRSNHKRAAARSLAELSDKPDDRRSKSAGQPRVQSKVYGFSVGRYRFLLARGTAIELTAKPDLAEVPNTPEHFAGLTNHRGHILPVYNLLPVLLPDLQEPARYGLVIGRAEHAAVILLPGKPVSIVVNKLKPLRYDASENHDLNVFVKRYYEFARQTWGLLDTQQLFAFLASADIKRAI